MLEERFVTATDGARLWTAVEGSGSPMIMCHGGPGLWDYLGGLAQLLTDDFRVCRWDQRGCGRSDPVAHVTVEEGIRDVQEVRLSLGAASCIVLGHSWGAYLALVTALVNPDTTRALVYISGIAPMGWWRRTGSRINRDAVARKTPPAAQARLDELQAATRSPAEEVEFRRLSWVTDYADVASPPPELDAMASSPLTINYDVNRSLRDSEADFADDEALQEMCRNCSVPTLIIHGSEDPRPDGGARLLAEWLPESSFVSIAGGGHLPWVERPAEVRTAITSFLSEV